MAKNKTEEMVEKKPEEEEEGRVRTLTGVYPLNPPYVYAAVERNPATGGLRYLLIEPKLSNQEISALDQIKDILVAELDVSLTELGSQENAEKYLRTKISEIIRKYKIKVPKESLEKLNYYLIRDFLGFGKIDGLMKDPEIEDISCNGPGVPVYVWHRVYESIPTNIVFETEGELETFAVRLAYMSGRHVSLARPMLDASLPDGSRIQLNYGREVSRKGSSFTIRKFRADPLTVTDLIRYNTLSPEMAAYLWFMIENRVSVIIAGGIAAGKTTTLNVLATFIKPDLKIVSIEDTPEIRLLHENWLPQVTRTGLGGEGGRTSDIELFDLLKAAVRQRPDYIIVGEVRGAEAYTLFQAMATGHLGMCTIHAESVDAMIHRLESEPMNIPRTLLTTLDLIAVQRRVIFRDKVLRRIVTLSEIVGMDPATRELITNEVYRWNPVNDAFERLRRSYRLEEIVKIRGMTMEEAEMEIERRKEILEWMVQNNIRHYEQVNKIIRDYYANPDRLYKRIKVGVT